MPSQATLDHLEVIVGAMLVALALVSMIAATVGTLTLLLTREHVHPATAGPKSVPVVRLAAARQPSAEAPASVAG